MIKHLKVKYSFNFNCKLLKYTFNQISMNKVLNKKSTNKLYCLNLAAYNLTKSIRINHLPLKAFNKPYNKTFITYNHFKGFKQAFNHNIYKGINVMRFCLVDRLKGFKIGINKKVRLKIYKWGLVEIILLISSFGWSNIKVEFIPDKFTKD